MGQRGERRVGHRGDGRRARAGVEQGQLAEHLAGAEDREEVLAAVAGGAAELHLAVDDDVEPVAGVALVEEHVAAAQLRLAHRATQGGGGLVVERAEERRLTQYVVVHDVLHPRPARRTSVAAAGRSRSYPVAQVTCATSVGAGHRRGAAVGCPRASRLRCPRRRTGLVRRARKIDRVLAETYPDARIELDFDNPFQLLVVTVLSAQTTDRRVNAVRPTLFAAYPDAAAMAAAPREHLEQIIGPLGFFRAKTDSLLKLSAALVERYDGQVPPRLDRPGHPPRSRPQDRERRARQRASASPASPSTPTSAGSHAGSAGPTRPTRSRSSTPSARCSREARLGDALPPPDLARPPGVPRQEARVRCLPGRPLVPVVRRGADRPRSRSEAGKTEGPA